MTSEVLRVIDLQVAFPGSGGRWRPVVEAAVFVIAVLVFGVSAAVDLLLPALDPRLRSPAP